MLNRYPPPFHAVLWIVNVMYILYILYIYYIYIYFFLSLFSLIYRKKGASVNINVLEFNGLERVIHCIDFPVNSKLKETGNKNFPIWYLLKKENQRISNVLKGCKKRPVASNSLRISTLSRITNIFFKKTWRHQKFFQCFFVNSMTKIKILHSSHIF